MLELVKNIYPYVGDLELAKKINQDDKKSINYFIHQYSGEMLSTARKVTHNEADARDCVQTALINALSHIHQFNGKSSLATWLKRIVTNTALMLLRTQSRRKEESLDSDSLQYDHHSCGLLSTPIFREARLVEDLVYQGETRLAIQAALKQLPREYRAVVIARDIVGFDTKETALLLDISAELVRTRLYRARSTLRTLLAPYSQAEAA